MLFLHRYLVVDFLADAIVASYCYCGLFVDASLLPWFAVATSLCCNGCRFGGNINMWSEHVKSTVDNQPTPATATSTPFAVHHGTKNLLD
jgi:hypothetical protein